MANEPSFEHRTYAKVDWRLIPFLFLCYILAYLDRVNVGFAKLQMLKDLGLSEAAFATGAGIFFLGYFFFEVPSNLLLKRFGARIWIARIMISWGLVSSAMMFVHSAWAFYAMRLFLGFAEAGFFPGIIFYLTLWYPSRLRSSRTALFVSAIAVAGVLGNPVSGLIMDSLSGTSGLAGWQWLFLAEGIPSILVGVWVLFYLDSGIAEARWLSAAEKALLARNLQAEDGHKQQVRIIDAFKSGKVYALCAIYFTLMIGLYGISFWLPTIVKAFGVRGYLNTGLITAIPYAVAVVGMILLSRHSDRTGERRMHYVLNVTAGGIGLILSGIFADRPALAMIFLSIGTLGVIGSMPLFWPVPSTFLAGTAAAAGIGVVNSVGNLGGYIGPNVPIWVQSISTDPSAALYAIAAALFAGALLAFVFIPRNPAIGRQVLSRPSKPGRMKWIALAVLVCGLLGWALIGWVRGTIEPPQFLTWPDGTKCRFGGVTWGTNHVPPSFAERAVYHLPAVLSSWVQQKYGARLRLVTPLHTDEPALCVWLEQIEIPTNRMFASVSAMPHTACLADSDGVEAGTSYGYFGSFSFWESAAFAFVPRRSRMLEVHFYHDGQSGRSALSRFGSMRFQNPLYGKFPQWQPEPLPATKMAGDVPVTLVRCSVGDSAAGRFWTSFVMDLKQPLGTNEHWTIQRVEASDATGNRISRDMYAFPGWGECLVPALFWPDEKAIRLKVGLKRTAGFTRNETITVTNLPLPVANATNGVTLTNRVGGHTVLVRNYVESMPLRIFLTDGGSLPGPYGISMVVADQPAELFAQIESVNTDSGELSYEHQSNRNPTGDSCSFRSFPSNTGSLNVTVSVQKVRTVEFLVKPPNAK